MTALPLLYSAWTALAILLLSLLVYRSTLIRYEDEKLFLDSHDEGAEKQQTDIIRKVTRIQPLVTTTGAATGLITLSIIGILVYNALVVLRS